MLESEAADGGGDDVLAHGTDQELLVVVDEGVDEETEEVFDNIGKFVGREVVHDSEEGERLLLEEAVDGLRGSGIDEIGTNCEFAENGIRSPKEASLARVLEAGC